MLDTVVIPAKGHPAKYYFAGTLKAGTHLVREQHITTVVMAACAGDGPPLSRG